MSARVMDWAWEQETGAVSSRLVLLALAFHANDNGEYWMEVPEVVAATRLSRASVYRAFSDLESAGLIKRLVRP